MTTHIDIARKAIHFSMYLKGGLGVYPTKYEMK